MKTKKKKSAIKKIPSLKKSGPAMAQPKEPAAPHQGIWSGTISFSLVAIPVRLVKAVEPGRVSFRMLHGRDYSPLERKMFCPDEEKIVPPEEIVRGYEIEPGKHLVITDEELESVSPERSRTIEILEFVNASDIDPIYYDHPYYLSPLKGGEKSYCLLAEALQRSGRAGIAKFVLGEREYLVAVKSRDKVLEVSTLHYSSEIQSDEALIPADAADPAEVSTLKNSIKKMMTVFSPEQFSDPRRKKLMEILRDKAKEKKEVQSPDTGEKTAEGVEDLVAALEASMRNAEKEK